MNPIDRALQDDLTHLVDRLAASVPHASLDRIMALEPSLRARLDDAESGLSALRLTLLDGYATWRRTLEELEVLWSEATCGSVAPAEEASEQAASLAA